MNLALPDVASIAKTSPRLPHSWLPFLTLLLGLMFTGSASPWGRVSFCPCHSRWRNRHTFYTPATTPHRPLWLFSWISEAILCSPSWLPVLRHDPLDVGLPELWQTRFLAQKIQGPQISCLLKYKFSFLPLTFCLFPSASSKLLSF